MPYRGKPGNLRKTPRKSLVYNELHRRSQNRNRVICGVACCLETTWIQNATQAVYPYFITNDRKDENA